MPVTINGSGTIGSLTSQTFSDGTQIGTAYSLGMRNRIINGDMRIDQRNTGASVSSGLNLITYTLDRWSVAAAGAAVTAQRTGSAAAYYLTVTGAASVTQCNIRQRIESLNIADLAGSTVTVSFTCSSTTLTSIAVGLLYANSADTFSATTSISSTNVTISSTATRYSVTTTLPANAANGVELAISLGAFTSGTFSITNVQLEAGSVVTPFEKRYIGHELILCQRYYQQIVSLPGGGSGYAAISYYGGSSALLYHGHFWTRILPNLAYLNSANVQYYSYAGAWTASTPSATAIGSGPYMITSWFTGDGDGRGKLLRKNDANNLILTISAEL